MNINRYKQRLIEMETRLSSRKARDVQSGREQLIDTAAETGDASVADEAESEDFTEADRNRRSNAGGLTAGRIVLGF
jgi:hypothetical protein